MQIWGCAQFKFVKKLKSLKRPSKTLNATHFSHISARAKKADSELMELQMKLHDDASDSELQMELREKKIEVQRLVDANRMFLSQLAKFKYLKESDRGSSFFHGSLKRNSNRNHISAVIKRNGEQANSISQVANEFLEFYIQLMGTDLVCSDIKKLIITRGSLLNDSHKQNMISPISDEEVKMALFDIGDDKSPGPDGFFAGFFFFKFWNTVGKEFIRGVKEFFATSKLLKQINCTAIALIPKSSHALSVADYTYILL
ncbi:uncharacterized protein LOC131163526 [Malania oleifera]|uniref:uncharacterized protein LOC131163526 n=1 Tax=Malania oleifera TaxID=397392 RepID=UPI0025ADFA9A|nr:uncharacterized protein LOC131163526 [Malania oleifera]